MMNSLPSATPSTLPLPGFLHHLKTAQALLLTDPDAVWLVERGRLELHLTDYHDGRPAGRRHYLFQLPARSLAFGFQPVEAAAEPGWVGVAAADTEVREMRFSQFFSEMLSENSVCRPLTESWIEEIHTHMSRGHEPPGIPEALDQPGDQPFERGRVFAPPSQKLVLLQVISGSVALFGRSDFTIEPNQGPLLMGAKMWLQVMSEKAEIAVRFLGDPGDAPLFRSAFERLHRLFSLHLRLQFAEEETSLIERRKASRAQEKLAATTASEKLASVAKPKDYFPVRETPLLTAVSVLGQLYGVRINPPAPSEDLSLVNDPVEAIARASRIRCRKIRLAPNWWTRDSGPLLAFAGEERRPIVLIPHGSGYDYVDPDGRRREPLTQPVRALIHPEAYMFYRPFPDFVERGIQVARFALGGRTGDVLFIVSMGVLATLLGMLVPRIIGELVDSAIPSADRGYVVQLALILGATGVAAAIFTFVQVMTTLRSGLLVDVGAQSALWDRLLKLSPRFFRRYTSGELQMRVNAVGEICRDMNAATMRPFISGVLALLNFLLLWYYSWELAKWALLVGLFMLVIVLGVGHFVREVSKSLLQAESDTSSLVIQMIGGVAKIRVAGSEQRAINFWLTKYSAQLQLLFRLQRLKDVMSVVNRILMPLATAVIFWKAVDVILGTASVTPGNPADVNLISLGDFIAFNTAFTLYLTGWTDLTNALVQMLDAVAKGYRIKPLIEEGPEVRTDAADPGRLKGAVRVENIQFRYTHDGPLVIDDVSLDVGVGEYVALVGPSGSGKSTLLRILLGFEKPQYGRVLFDGQDLSGLDVLAVRRQIGTVLQNGRLNAGSIIDNIANNAPLSLTRIWDAVADAALSDDIQEMPMGIHTLVSEGGGNLSGGQRQRLLIARALALWPKIVIFDEATSALDNHTQAVVSGALDRRKVTRIVIAHRLSTIRQADRIFVMDKGRIVQVGNYEELSRQDGPFRSLMARQMV